jgi:anti-anti-sigma regulatory factor
MATASSTLVKLPASVDLDAIESVRESLLEALEAGPVTVSGAEVERVSTNALLMLVSAAETARRNSFGFDIADVSAPMASAIDRLGLGEPFAGMMRG